MKNFIIAFILLLWAHNRPSAQGSPNFCGNRVTLNGHPLNYDTFAINSRGVLAVVEGNPELPKRRPVPFRVLLRRAGVIVGQWPCGNADESYAVQLHDFMPLARLGDELVVEPVRETDQQGKRVIKIKNINWFVLDEC